METIYPNRMIAIAVVVLIGAAISWRILSSSDDVTATSAQPDAEQSDVPVGSVALAEPPEVVDLDTSTEAAELVEPVEATDEPVPGGRGDVGALGELESLNISVVIVTGTVVELGGPVVTVKDGLVDYDRGPDGTFPSVRVRLDVEAQLLDRDDHMLGLMAPFLASIESQSEVNLMTAGGKFEVGRQYALFVGPWEPELSTIFYAFDIARDGPADGFTRGFDEDTARAIHAAEATSLSYSSKLDLFVELADGLRSPWDERDPNAYATAFLENRRGSAVDQSESDLSLPEWYPVDASDAGEEDIRQLAMIEIRVSGLVDGEYYALQGDERSLGWFVANSNGVVIFGGYVDPQKSYVVVGTDDISLPPVPVSSGEVFVDADQGQGFRARLDLDDEGHGELTNIRVND